MAMPRALPGSLASLLEDIETFAPYDPVRVETVPRVANPFARFRTRSQWLSTMIRAGREASPAPRGVPEWFNR